MSFEGGIICFPSEVHLGLFAGETENLSFDKNTLLVDF